MEHQPKIQKTDEIVEKELFAQDLAIQDDRFLASFVANYVCPQFDRAHKELVHNTIQRFVRAYFHNIHDPATSHLNKEQLVQFLKDGWVHDESTYSEEERKTIQEEKEIIKKSVQVFWDEMKKNLSSR